MPIHLGLSVGAEIDHKRIERVYWEKLLTLCTRTYRALLSVSLPPGPVTVSVTGYTPAVLYTCVGLRSPEVSPSPNSHHHDVMSPELASVKTTVRGAVPAVGVPVNPATGATGGAATVM
jgi:hypothetical protein